MVNTTEDIKKFINDKSLKKIFVLCGKKSFVTSGAENLFKKIITDKEIKLFYKKSELPILEELIEIINDIKNFKPDLILAVGGGAVIDYAKIANVVDVREDLADLIVNYSYPFKKKYTKLTVIPTTAGSGAEVTSNAVIYVDGIKHSFESELLIPDNFFLIPEFLISAPNKIKASAGFDAIAQALESLISKKSNVQSVEYASKSLRVSINSFISFIKDKKLFTDIFNDLDAYSTLWLLDFFDTKDSNAWAIASKPADALILFGAEIKNSGIKKKLSGTNN